MDDWFDFPSVDEASQDLELPQDIEEWLAWWFQQTCAPEPWWDYFQYQAEEANKVA